MSKTRPTLVFVPGYWEGTSVYDHISSILSSRGYSVSYAPLVSTGTTSPGNPSLHDGVEAIRAVIKSIVEEEKEVVLVLHSAGGFLGSNATERLSCKAREGDGRKGGIIKIVFLAAGVFPEGHLHGDLPIFVKKDGALTCLEPEVTLFNDITDDETQEWLSKFKSQPAEG